MTNQNDQPELKKKPDYVWKYYAYSGLAGLSFGIYMPIWILFLLDRGFNLATLGLFSGVMTFFMFALEIPTGIIADKISRKWSVFLGLLFQGISAFTIVATTNYTLVLIGGYLFFGLGLTLRSGADSALLYDSMKADGGQEAFHKTIGNSFSLMFLGTVAGNLLCGVIVRYTGLAGPYWAGFILFLLTASFPAMIKEPPFLEETRTNVKTSNFKLQKPGVRLLQTSESQFSILKRKFHVDISHFHQSGNYANVYTAPIPIFTTLSQIFRLQHRAD